MLRPDRMAQNVRPKVGEATDLRVADVEGRLHCVSFEAEWPSKRSLLRLGRPIGLAEHGEERFGRPIGLAEHGEERFGRPIGLVEHGEERFGRPIGLVERYEPS